MIVILDKLINNNDNFLLFILYIILFYNLNKTNIYQYDMKNF